MTHDYVAETTTGSKMMLCSGEYFDLSCPKAELIRVEDIAHALSRLSRFNGHTLRWTPLTVAQHSVLVAELTSQITNDNQEQLYALLHDAHEAYIGDITYPVKRALLALMSDYGDPIAKLKDNVQGAIHAKMGLPWPVPEEWARRVKLADSAALVLEKDRFMPGNIRDRWFADERFVTTFDPDAVSSLHRAWPHSEAEQIFLRCIEVRKLEE